MCGEGVPVWFPRNFASDIPFHVADSPALIAFYSEREPTKIPNVLVFTPILLFRLAKDRYSRINFIRWLGRQIKTGDMMPSTFDLALLPTGDDAIHRYTAWLLDLHGIPLASESVLELIVFYSGSNSFLFRALINEIAGLIENRDEGVKIEHVHRAWNNSRFRDTAIAHLLKPIGEDPWLLSILACAYFISEAGEPVTTTDISEWLSVFGYAGEKDVSTGIRELVRLNLLAKGDNESTAMINRSALGLLVREHVIDLEQFVKRQLNL
jgi:hypothetical protein